MPTYSALTTLPGEAAAQSLAAAMERMDPEPTGVGVFEIEDGSGLWEVGGYFLDAPDQVMLEVLATAFGARPFADLGTARGRLGRACAARIVAPVDAGRFFVYGSHDADKVPGSGPGAAADRGDGGVRHRASRHHAWAVCWPLTGFMTAGCSQASVIDVGCGTAVLAMAAAATLPDALVIASPTSTRSRSTWPRRTWRSNGLQGRIECLEAAGLDHPPDARGQPL
jgi:ribosomal protein L11 methyltransferase